MLSCRFQFTNKYTTLNCQARVKTQPSESNANLKCQSLRNYMGIYFYLLGFYWGSFWDMGLGLELDSVILFIIEEEVAAKHNFL